MTNLIENINWTNSIGNWIFYILGAAIVISMIFHLSYSKNKVEKKQALELMSLVTVFIIGVIAFLRVLSIIFDINYTRTIDPIGAIVECAIIYHVIYFYYMKKNKQN